MWLPRQSRPNKFVGEVAIIREGSWTQPGTSIGGGPGLCGTSENGGWANFVEARLAEVRHSTGRRRYHNVPTLKSSHLT
jgi:hypothetical protein